MPRLFALES